MAPGPRVVAIVGATATGKTALAESLALRIGGEVVCADSRQVYRELEIGTGKPSPEERGRLPHHLFDTLSLCQSGSAGWYARAAADACRDILGRDRVPVLVGGSGLYLRALERGIAAVPPHAPEIRARLLAEARAEGAPALHARLRLGDPETASRLAPADLQRVTRALEVLETSGRPLSWWHRQPAEPPLGGEWSVFEIVFPARKLAERITARTRSMFDAGLAAETRALVEAGLEEPLRRLRAVGYDEALALNRGVLTRAEAEERTNQRTRQLAKRQRTWFRHQIEATRLDAESLDLDSLERSVRPR